MNQELMKPEQSEVVEITTGAGVMLADAVAGKCDKDTIELIAKLYREEKEDQRRVGYDEAMSRVQQLIPPIISDSKNGQTNSRYAKTHTINNIMRPIYGVEGFAIEFGEEDSPHENMIRYIATCSRAGHSRVFHVDLPADNCGIKGSVNKTMIHALKSSGTYAQGILLRRIFNLVEQDNDNDGNGAKVEVITADQAIQLDALIEKAGAKRELVLKYAGVTKFADFPANKLQPVIKNLNKKIIKANEVKQ